MKIPETKQALEKLIKKEGSRRKAAIALGLSTPAFYKLVHRLGLSIETKWQDYGKMAAGCADAVTRLKRDNQKVVAAAVAKAKVKRAKAKPAAKKTSKAKPKAKSSKKASKDKS